MTYHVSLSPSPINPSTPLDHSFLVEVGLPTKVRWLLPANLRYYRWWPTVWAEWTQLAWCLLQTISCHNALYISRPNMQKKQGINTSEAINLCTVHVHLSKTTVQVRNNSQCVQWLMRSVTCTFQPSFVLSCMECVNLLEHAE